MGLADVRDAYPGGAHICYLYHDDEERRTLIPEFIRGGLAAGEMVAYFADVVEPGMPEELEELGLLPIDEARQHHLVPRSAVSTYCPRNRFVPKASLAMLRGYYERGCAEGLSGTRICGEMGWALRGIPGSEQLLDYESRINGLIAASPMTVLCAYDMRRFDGATAFAVLGMHPMLLVHGQIASNPY
jgi:DcmR-like sensory protein